MKTTYQIDPAHTSAQFSVRHMMITNVRGGFGRVEGTVVYDSDNPSASSVIASSWPVGGIPERDWNARTANAARRPYLPLIRPR